jgi:mRNA interferase HicA
MARLPVLSPREVIRALERGGFVVARVTGSHYIMRHRDDATRETVVPFHAGDVVRPTIAGDLASGAP